LRVEPNDDIIQHFLGVFESETVLTFQTVNMLVPIASPVCASDSLVTCNTI